MKREIFPNSDLDQVWIEGGTRDPDSKILLTISNAQGEHTALITPTEIAQSKAKMFVQAPPERIITKSQQKQQRYANIVRMVGYVLSTILISFSALSVTGYVKARVVLTGSMAPTIKSGDIVILIPTKHRDPKIGDVVAYTGRRFDGSAVGVFTHRIIAGDAATGFTVKGDANPSPDVQKPKLADISGIVLFAIPFIGHFLTPKALLIFVPLIFGLWLVIDALRKDA
ncbi:MAG: signal peptidase I [Actinomycetes bacterium]